MIHKFNYLFWRNKAFWILGFIIWSIFNGPAVINYWDSYETVRLAIWGLAVSLSLIPIGIGVFYIVSLIVNGLVKYPLVADVITERLEVSNEHLSISRADTVLIIPFSEIGIVVKTKNFIALHIRNFTCPEVILRSSIGDREFTSTAERLETIKPNYKFRMMRGTKLKYILMPVYGFSTWVLWFYMLGQK